jgi:hypothetical protein
MRIVLRSILLGGMTEAMAGWEEWPVDLDRFPPGAREDAKKARLLAETLKLDEVGWRFEVFKANRIGGQREFRELAVRIARQLERHEVLTGEDLKRIHDAVREDIT